MLLRFLFFFFCHTEAHFSYNAALVCAQSYQTLQKRCWNWYVLLAFTLPFDQTIHDNHFFSKVAESKRLKALVTMAGPDVICVGAGKESQEVLKVSISISIENHCVNCSVFLFLVTANRTRSDVHLPDVNGARRRGS